MEGARRARRTNLILAMLASTAIVGSAGGCAEDAAAIPGPPPPEVVPPPSEGQSKEAHDGGVGPGAPSDGGEGDAGAIVDGGDGGDTPPPETPAVRWVGRLDTRDSNGPKVGWPGAGVVVRFRGTSLGVRITEQSLYTGPSRYDLIVDGTLRPTPFAPSHGTADHVLVSGLSDAVHVVELWRRTESFVGTTQFRGFDFGAGELLAPPPAATRRIEFLGDSAANGYGVECTNQSQSFSGATQNERKAYPALVAKALGAEHHNISYSGKGILRNYDNADNVVFGQLYGRSLAEDATSTWSFASWTPDVVVIALGGNDWDRTDSRPAPNVAAFKTRYHETVTLARSHYPNAQILCTVAGSLNDNYPAGYNAYTNVTTILKAVVDERHKAPYEDPKVHYYELPRAQSLDASGAPDMSGCEGHSSASFHTRATADMTTKIKSITGW